MSPEPFDRLRTVHLFAGVSDGDLRQIASTFQSVEFQPGETLAREGELADAFDLIHAGQVELERLGQPGGVLEPGDTLTEPGRPHLATARAKDPVTVLRLEAADFADLLKRLPSVRSSLDLVQHTRRRLARQPLQWSTPGEVIYWLGRRHPALLYQALTLPGILAAVGLSLGLATLAAAGSLWLPASLMIAGLAWGAWAYADWTNDTYLLSNRRVVWVEKVIGIYDSRTEAPLWSIRAVKVATTVTSRALGYGDVTVQTLSGTVAFRDVAEPRQVAALIEEHWQRVKARQQTSDKEGIQAALRDRLFPDSETPTAVEPPAAERVTVTAGPPPERRTEGRRPAWTSFKLRIESGDVVTYRKHWFVLVRDLAWPSAGLLFVTGLTAASVIGQLPQFSTSGILSGSILVALALAGWWWYEFEDWQNDIYQVTHNQLVDRNKKPFGSESRKVAPLENILSAQVERKGLWPLVFNYGHVAIQTGGQAGELRFENVFDPVGVQQDVYRRLEAVQARRQQEDAQRRWEETLEWLSAYHRMSQTGGSEHEAPRVDPT